MKTIYILIFSIVMLSCQKEKTSLPIEENSIAISSQLKTDKLQNFEFVLKKDTLISGKEGTKVWITKDLFENYTNGKITFELKEFYSKEDMILNGLSTVTDKDELLESSGMFYINFKEGDKQLKIKKGKSYDVTIPNKPLAESNIYYNNNDSIFSWELSENKIHTEISDIVRNLEYFKSGKWKYENIPDKFKKRVAIDSLEIVKKRDSLKYLKIINEDNKKSIEALIESNSEWAIVLEDQNLTKEEEIVRHNFYENQNQIYSFTSDKLGWINIDKILAYEVEKEITYKNTNQDLKYFSFNLIYQNNQSLLNYNLGQFDTYLNKTKIIGKIKVVVYANSGNKIMFDSFYIDKNSKSEFDLNFKEITLDKLNQELISN
ncbi:hypothetical protein [Flavobacterium sp. UBA6195]|mgnify:CR=1 FL=1|uniref:hypothetical protein n=1 Tax=Flavobacterium sp. UBA6195 TaxID=1946554 RepID=UPI0025C1F7A7|nr:hypothetical protein [Flavobacterium sp. UBA6195]